MKDSSVAEQTGKASACIHDVSTVYGVIIGSVRRTVLLNGIRIEAYSPDLPIKR